MKTVYIGRIPEMTRNLVTLYRKRATPADIALGSIWYDDAHRIMVEWSDSYGYSIATCAAVTAAISPQCDWPRNLIIADDILAGCFAPSIGGALNANIDKAKRLRDTRCGDTRAVFKSGPKVYHFSRNLAGDYSAVTVDTHAAQAALRDVTVTIGLNAAKYSAFADAYMLAAGKLDIKPAVFQAIIWHTWKRLHPRANKAKARQQWHAVGEF